MYMEESLIKGRRAGMKAAGILAAEGGNEMPLPEGGEVERRKQAALRMIDNIIRRAQDVQRRLQSLLEQFPDEPKGKRQEPPQKKDEEEEEQG